ncbi:MAG: hypothetical protein JST00_22325 [Deltaproteobacteria bacterium]|nr:hypothetical protein [Deltaproteobacteria bacterium]
MNSRLSTLAALVVTFASFALTGCAADAADDAGASTESSITEREATPDLRAEEAAKVADVARAAADQDLRRDVTASAKVARADRPELTPVPGFAKTKRVERDQALEAAVPAVAGPNFDIEMPELGR